MKIAPDLCIVGGDLFLYPLFTSSVGNRGLKGRQIGLAEQPDFESFLQSIYIYHFQGFRLARQK